MRKPRKNHQIPIGNLTGFRPWGLDSWGFRWIRDDFDPRGLDSHPALADNTDARLLGSHLAVPNKRGRPNVMASGCGGRFDHGTKRCALCVQTPKEPFSASPRVRVEETAKMTARSTRVGFVRSSIHESSKPRGLDSAKMRHFLGRVLQERSRSDLSMARFVSLQTTDIWIAFRARNGWDLSTVQYCSTVYIYNIHRTTTWKLYKYIIIQHRYIH